MIGNEFKVGQRRQMGAVHQFSTTPQILTSTFPYQSLVRVKVRRCIDTHKTN